MKTVIIQTPELEGKLISFKNEHTLNEYICSIKDIVDYFIRDIPCTDKQKQLLENALEISKECINILRKTEQIKITFKQ